MHNRFGKNIKIEIYGGSHTKTLGINIYGLPKDFTIELSEFEFDLSRRRPGALGTTKRIESDVPHLIWNNDNLQIEFLNENIDDSAYLKFVDHPRPSHADLVQYKKYGYQYNMYGGGMASGRMTLPLVALGVICKKLLKEKYPNISIDANIIQIKDETNPDNFESIISKAIKEKTSLGAIIKCVVSNMPKYVGEPFFDSLESIISHLIFSIPGIKGIEFGDGFSGVLKTGIERNDLIIDKDGKTSTNNEGGINGGISNGMPVEFNVAVKPTASIYNPQDTFNFKDNKIEPLQITGRHDVCFARRVPVIIEAITAYAILELIG